MMTFFRAISVAEANDLKKIGRFRGVVGTLEGKWLAETAGNALEWGRRFSLMSGIHHDIIVRIEMDDLVAARLFKVENLDAIGPAYYAGVDDLLNATWELLP
jgi:hypothetical protein